MFNSIKHVGFIGLGAMGSGIARRLKDAGYDVTVWNRTRARADELVASGCRWADTPRQVAESCDLVFSMLTNTAAIRVNAAGDDGVIAGLSPGKIWADLSTIAPFESVKLAEEVRETGAHFLDCPVSGSPATLAAGQMSVMVGGDKGAFDHVEQVLRAIGPKVTWIGPNGHALLTKVAINLTLVVSVTAMAEAVALVEKAGVDRERVVDAMLKSVVASPVVQYRAPLLIADTDVYADVELQQKDLVLAQELARTFGAAVPTCSAASDMLSAARSSKLNDRDFLLSVHEAYLRIAGVSR